MSSKSTDKSWKWSIILPLIAFLVYMGISYDPPKMFNQGWYKNEERVFIEACVESALSYWPNTSLGQIEEYCECILEGMQTRFPEAPPDDAELIEYDKSGERAEVALECEDKAQI